MAKVNKAYSLDIRTIEILERYCQAHDNWDRSWSRSKVVNDAICWYLEGDNADMVTRSHKELLQNFKRVCLENTQLKEQMTVHPPIRDNRRWWMRILGLRF